ncbi:MAG: histidine phosphatase family protein [Actinomycetota bacterium]|nr:histidine phosphatase family protein [Actinomycetota bacterium]
MTGVRHPVYLVRHGQSEWNVLRLTQGQTPHPRLTELGHSQAAAAAELIAADLAHQGLTADRLLTSDLTRAVETADVIGSRLLLTAELEPRLREQHLGRLEGRSYEETWAAAEALDWTNAEAPIEGGESLMAVLRRMADIVDGLAAEQVNVLVSHGESIRTVLAHLQGLAPNDAPWVEVPNGAVIRFDGEFAWLSRPDVAAASVSGNPARWTPCSAWNSLTLTRPTLRTAASTP